MNDEQRKPEARGFSLVEALVALAVFLTVLAIVFSFFVDYGKNVNTQSGNLDAQTAARVSLDELARNIQQTGYNIDRAPDDDPTLWQRDIVYAGTHTIAFNADLDPNIGPIPSSVTVNLPTSDTYAGQGPAGVLGGAETYIYTIDANDDNVFTNADRTASVSGSYNPAADTPNPLDFALFKRTYGWNGTSYGGTLVPVGASIFTNATSATDYPDGTSPEPLFEYWLTEDLDRNRALTNVECVIGTCPPSTTRQPQLYLWGDTNLDGTLSESEKDFIRDKPVGSPAWSKNPLVTSGSYNSTTLSAAFDPAGTEPYILKVASVAKFGSGMYVQIDTGSNAEFAVVEEVLASNNTVTLYVDILKAHAAGTTVTVLPQTLLRAVRAVKIQFDSIAPEADTYLGAQTAGHAARKGTKGMDYQVRRFDKTVELANLQTDPLVGGIPLPTPCPLYTFGQCAGADVTTVRAYFPSANPTPVNFFVKNIHSTPVGGATLNFAKTNAYGTINATTGVTDSGGIVAVGYTATAVGDSTVTASGTCTDQYYNTVNFSDTILVKGTKLEATMTNDCVSTVSSRTAAPSSSFTVKATDSGGPVLNSPVRLSLQFDTAYLASPPDYAKVQADLYVAGTKVGSTNSSGGFSAWTGDTGGTGTLSGAVVLSKDTAGTGAKVNLVVTAPADTCWPASGALAQGVTYLKLDLATQSPTGCTETSPCLIAAGADAPAVVGTLTVNSLPIPGATVNFTKTDFHPAPDSPAASALLLPSATVTTNSSGAGTVYVGNNGSSSITSANPLATTVDASTLAEGYCTSPSIVPVSARPKFVYQGSSPAGKCDADMQQAWLYLPVPSNKGDVCMLIQNPPSARACALRPTGFKFTVYKVDNVTLDPNAKMDDVQGGFISTSPSVSSCVKTGTLGFLFKKACNVGGASLANDTRWDFVDNSSKGCYKPTTVANSGEYFALADIGWNIDVTTTDRKVVVTVYYACDGLCSTSPGVSESWTLHEP